MNTDRFCKVVHHTINRRASVQEMAIGEAENSEEADRILQGS